MAHLVTPDAAIKAFKDLRVHDTVGVLVHFNMNDNSLYFKITYLWIFILLGSKFCILSFFKILFIILSMKK